MNPLDLLSGGIGGNAPGIANVGDGGSGKSSAVAKTNFGDRSSNVTTKADQKNDPTPFYLVAAIAAAGVLILVLKD
jgi:hypothetical protein